MFDIQVALSLMDDSLDDQPAKDTIDHELLHTVPCCFKYTRKLRQHADLINKLLPRYSIKTYTSYEEMGVADYRAAPIYRYVLKNDGCGREVFRQKKCAVFEHPEHYRCKCGAN